MRRERLCYLGKMCAFSCDIPTQAPLQQPESAQASAVRPPALEVAGLIRTHG